MDGQLFLMSTLLKPLSGLGLAVLLTGCGLTQSVSETSTDLTLALFTRPVKTLHLQFDAPAAVNTHGLYMNALTVPTRLRVYQLSDVKQWQAAQYDQLLDDPESALNADVLAEQTLVIKPGTELPMNELLHPDARAIAIVAWVREPNLRAQSWRLTLSRDDLVRDQPRRIELGDNRLVLRPVGED